MRNNEFLPFLEISSQKKSVQEPEISFAFVFFQLQQIQKIAEGKDSINHKRSL
jgi:hypothetical protein